MTDSIISRRHALQLFGLWLLLVAISLYGRSFVPIDETRYVTVAWEMWLRGDFLVPYLNGEPYSHKPPLLFWLIQLGWMAFGVNDWWPRLMPSLFTLGSVWLTMRLAARLYPDKKELVRIVPLILMGSLLWALFTAATMFDMLVTFFTLVGMHGILSAWRGRPLKGWLVLGSAIGAGMLAKGPVILLLTALPAALAPWWGQARPHRWQRWYGGLGAAMLMGVLIVLIWAVPAGAHGGAAYRSEIFWGQTAGRMVESFAHRRPIWWYLELLPVILLPWSLWPPLWRCVLRLREVMDEPGVRFCAAWVLPVFIAFCFISGKQMHYLLPLFPAFSLMAARALVLAPSAERHDFLPLLLVTLAASMSLLSLKLLMHSHPNAPWLQQIPHWGAALYLVGGMVLLTIPNRALLTDMWKTALYTVFVVASIYIGIAHQVGSAYDVRAIGARLKQLEDAGIPLAHAGDYAGMYTFVGRMRQAPEVVRSAELGSWFERHPDGRAIVYFDRQHPLGAIKPEYFQYYQDREVGILDRSQWQAWQAQQRRR